MNAVPYDSPQEDWDRYDDNETDEQLPGRPRRQFWGRRSAALIAVIVGAICFYAGVRVEKSQLSSSSTSAALPTTSTGGAGSGARAAAAGGSRAGAAGGFAGRSFGGGAGGGAGAAALGGAGAGGSASFGTINSISANTFYVTETSGNTVKVKLTSATKITKSVTVGKSAVRPGDTIVIRGLNSNGTVSATSISDSGAALSAFGGGSSGSGSSGSGSASSAVGSLFGSGSGG